MSDDRASVWIVGVGMLAVVVCCAGPVLVGSGVLATAAGIGAGSWLLSLAGAAILAVAGWRWRRRTTDQSNHSTETTTRER
jgi:membrane protein implicated in regulation of membrane protease activity